MSLLRGHLWLVNASNRLTDFVLLRCSIRYEFYLDRAILSLLHLGLTKECRIALKNIGYTLFDYFKTECCSVDNV
jgi:hypothetical protein